MRRKIAVIIIGTILFWQGGGVYTFSQPEGDENEVKEATQDETSASVPKKKVEELTSDLSLDKVYPYLPVYINFE